MCVYLVVIKLLPQQQQIGPRGVCALPLGVAAERSVHYIWYYFSSFLFLSVPHAFLLGGVVRTHACGAFMSIAQLQLNELN
jgi:hypothetical protein